MTTLAPSPAKLTAIARPIPELAPVTTAVLPASKLDIDDTLSRIRSIRGVILAACAERTHAPNGISGRDQAAVWLSERVSERLGEEPGCEAINEDVSAEIVPLRTTAAAVSDEFSSLMHRAQVVL
jgi:hypothetical protein